MENFEELKNKSHKWREWYYDGEPELDPVAQPVEEAFDLINATLFGHIYQRPNLETKIYPDFKRKIPFKELDI